MSRKFCNLITVYADSSVRAYSLLHELFIFLTSQFCNT